MGRVPRSSRSKPPPLLGLPCSVMGGSCILQKFLGMDVVNRQQRPRSQVVKEECQPESADGDGNNQIQRAEIEILMEVRFDVPEQVYKPHENQPAGKPNKFARIALEA